MIKGQIDLFARKSTLMKSAGLFRLDDYERYEDRRFAFFFSWNCDLIPTVVKVELRSYDLCLISYFKVIDTEKKDIMYLYHPSPCEFKKSS